MLILFQLAFILFSLIAIAHVVRHWRDHLFQLGGTIAWVLFWVLADLSVLWPTTTTVVANAFGIGRGADFILYLAIAGIFAVLFRLYVKIERVQRDVTTVVRDRAIQDRAKKDTL